MKKTILYLFFVFVLISFTNADFYDFGVTLDSSQNANINYTTCVTFKLNSVNETIKFIGGKKYDTSSCSYCELYDINITLIDSGFFNGNSCNLTTPQYLNTNISYYYCVYKNNEWLDTYKAIDIYPQISTYFTLLNDTYSTDRIFNKDIHSTEDYLETTIGFYYEIYQIPTNITPTNITPTNITGDLNNIAVSLELIGNNIYIIFIGLLVMLFLYLGYKINYNLWVVSGVLFWFIGLLDFNTSEISFNIAKFIFYVVIGITFIILGFVLELTRSNKQKPKNMYDSFY